MTINNIIISIMLLLSLACGFSMDSIIDSWKPDSQDISYISKTIWGEARGCCREEQEAVAWCILNRVDSDVFPDTIKEVVTAPYQFQGYSESNPDIFKDLVEDVLIRHHNGERGIDESLLYFSGNGGYNTFRNAWRLEDATLFWAANS